MVEAEALCDRIVVLRDGRALDSGTPAELVARHANAAMVHFTWPDPPAALLDEMRVLDGVRDVKRSAARITVVGNRAIIAYVGAVLVRYGSVPADLDVQVPSLDDAMLTLLNGAPAKTGTATETDERLVGGRR
jgi:ABC-2 type transport system ATP-binding protein